MGKSPKKGYAPSPPMSDDATAKWAYTELLAIARAFTEPDSLDLQAAKEPEKPRNGMIVYVDGLGWKPWPTATEGFYAFKGGAWVKLTEAPAPP